MNIPSVFNIQSVFSDTSIDETIPHDAFHVNVFNLHFFEHVCYMELCDDMILLF